MEFIRRVEYIIIHHSGTKDEKVFSWNAIRNYHINVNKWKDIGYHYGIDMVNDYPEIIIGRLPIYQGAHTFGLNSISIGICVIGNYDIEVIDEKKYERLLELVCYLILNYNVPVEKVIGHREVKVLYDLKMISFEVYQQNIKTCPGLNFSMKKLRKDIINKLNLKEPNNLLYNKFNEYDDYVMKNKKIV